MRWNRRKILATLLVVFLLIVLPLGSYYFLSRGKSLWDNRKVIDYTLMTQTGDSLSMAALKGKVHLAAFLYSSCTAPYCREVLATQAYLQKYYQDNPSVELLTITIDPEVDSLSTIQAWADSANANPEIWHFLTGPKRRIQRIAVSGYSITKLRFREPRYAGLKASPKLVLIGKDGFIKGYYHAGAANHDAITEAIAAQLKTSPQKTELQ